MELYYIDTGFGCGGVWVEDGLIHKTAPIFNVFFRQTPAHLLRHYEVTKISDEIERKCWNCFEPLEPTEELVNGGRNRVFQCPACGAKMLWVNEPLLNGSYAEKHALKGGGHSGISMLNDPECSVFGPAKYPPPPGPDDPKRKRIDGKSFRWHAGRERWVLWE